VEGIYVGLIDAITFSSWAPGDPLHPARDYYFSGYTPLPRYSRGWGGTPVAAVPRWAQGSSAMTLGEDLSGAGKFGVGQVPLFSPRGIG
jgi:hypothetical protein